MALIYSMIQNKKSYFQPFRLINTLRPKQNGRNFADDIFKCIFLNINELISLKISLKFVLKGPINNIPALVQIMAWRRPGDKPLFEPMMVSLPTHICVTRPQWVNFKIRTKWPTFCRCVVEIQFHETSFVDWFKWHFWVQLTLWDWVRHIWISKLCHHWLR